MIVPNNRSINVKFKLEGHRILWVALFQIAHVRYAVEEGQVVDDGVEIQVILFGPAGYFEVPHLPSRITAKHHDGLRFVRMLCQVFHDILTFDGHLSNIFVIEMICVFQIGDD